MEVGFALAFDVIFRRRQPALLGPARLSLSRRSLSEPEHTACSGRLENRNEKAMIIIFRIFILFAALPSSG
ncbi:hypothetical protein [Pararhizobium sp. LjRoot238]|uniref:hypothetical protein n=1 Tax=Pararhizobium sp. LjRoot238 TaxID=3342293 RepID=UPI003ECFEDAD